MNENNKENSTFYIYRLLRPTGEPFYIGKGNNGRLNVHRYEAEALRHKPGKKSLKTNIIHKLWKQGLDFTEQIIIEGLTESEAFSIELKLIAILGRLDQGSGCLANLTDGGEGMSGFIYTEETRKKRSAFMQGKQYSLGYRHSEEAKKKIGDASRGKKISEETKKKMSDAARGRILSEEQKQKLREANIGKRQSIETKLKRSAALRGRKRPDEVKQKISKAKMGHYVSPETKRKISETKLKKYKKIAIDAEVAYSEATS